MFKRKVETMSVKEFMERKEPVFQRLEEQKERKVDTGVRFKPIVKACVTAGVIVLSLSFGDVSLAAAGAVDGAVAAKVVSAFSPMVELVKAISYPICLIMMLGGGLFVTIGNSEKGLSMIQRAGLGYCLIQALPMLLDLLVEITKSL